MKYRKLSVIIPAYNEAQTIEEILSRVKNVVLGDLEKEIIVVDDGSRDGTRDILRRIMGIHYVFHERNKGKGGAIKTGISTATGDILLIQDADLEYDPEDYRVMIQPILAGETEFVMGSRFLLQKIHFFTEHGAPFFSHYIGNKLITWTTNFLYGQQFTDYEGCYKAFTAALAREIPIRTDGFAFDNELICKTLRRRHRIKEVPIRYKSRLYTDGKKITWRDGLKILWIILKCRFTRFD